MKTFIKALLNSIKEDIKTAALLLGTSLAVILPLMVIIWAFIEPSQTSVLMSWCSIWFWYTVFSAANEEQDQE